MIVLGLGDLAVFHAMPTSGLEPSTAMPPANSISLPPRKVE